MICKRCKKEKKFTEMAGGGQVCGDCVEAIPYSSRSKSIPLFWRDRK
tara:strand:+ start:411 stop:551 length:141 start_codon:yes stop_codon:yes gene_type:complete